MTEDITKLDIDVARAMLGSRADLGLLVERAANLNVPVAKIADYDVILESPRACDFVKSRSIVGDDVRVINQFLRWNVPDALGLLSRIPQEKWDRLLKVVHSTRDSLRLPFGSLRFENGKFVSPDADKKVVYLLNGETEIVSNLFGEPFSRSTNLYLDDLLRLSRKSTKVENADSRITLLNHFFPNGIKYALENQIPRRYIASIASAYELNSEFVIKNTGLIPLEYMRLAQHYVHADRHRKINFDNSFESDLRVNAAIMLSEVSKSLSRKLKKIVAGPEQLRRDIVETYVSHNNNLVEFGLNNALFGYRLDLPVIQLSNPKKMLEKVEQITTLSRTYENSIRQADLNEKQKELLNQVGLREKWITTSAINAVLASSGDNADVTLTKPKGLVACDLADLAIDIGGICTKTLSYIANVAGVNEADLRKVVVNNNNNILTAARVSERLQFLSALEQRPKSTLADRVEGYVRIVPTIKSVSGGFLGHQNRPGFYIALHANDEISNQLARSGTPIETHYGNGILAYARCYIEGEKSKKSLRIEEFQSDIFESKYPSSIKKKYEHWQQILLNALEHFAIETGMSRIYANPPYIQLKKWSGGFGLASQTAFNSYAKVHSSMGYKLVSTKLMESEYVGTGLNFGDEDVRISSLLSSKCRVGNQFDLAWEKKVDASRIGELESYFYISPQQKEVRALALQLRKG